MEIFPLNILNQVLETEMLCIPMLWKKNLRIPSVPLLQFQVIIPKSVNQFWASQNSQFHTLKPFYGYYHQVLEYR